MTGRGSDALEFRGRDTERLGVVFVNYHSEAAVEPRAKALVDRGHDVVVADNSGTFDAPYLVCVGMERNAGFGAACNRAVSCLPSRVDVVCFHNPDVDIAPASVEELGRRLRADTRIGAIAPTERVGTTFYPAGYRYPSAARELALGLRNLARLRRAGDARGLDPGSVQGLGSARTRVAGAGARRFPSAALLVVRRSAFESVGGFDERFFLYVEDLDLVHRLREAGFAVRVEPDVVAIHAAGEGSAMGRGRREVLRWLGTELFLEKTTGESWRSTRRVHRLLLPFYRAAWPALAAALAWEWRQWTPPRMVLDRVRGVLEAGGHRGGS